MSEKETDQIFTQMFLMYFYEDQGPRIIDYYTTQPLDVDIDNLDIFLLTRSAGGLKEDIVKEVYGRLWGPDVFPIGGRAIWFNWFMKDRFATDPRISKHGATATLYCVFDSKDEKIINKSRDVIERVLIKITNQLTSIEDIIKRILQIKEEIITKDHYEQVKNRREKVPGQLIQQIHDVLTQQVVHHWTEVVTPSESFEKMPTPHKLQTIVKEEGKKEPAIIYLVLANHKGLPIAEYSQGYQAEPRWINTTTVVKMDGIRRIAHGLLLDRKFYDQQIDEEGMNRSFTELMKGESEVGDPGLILIETPEAYTGMKQATINGISNNKHTYYIFARCKKTMQKGMLELVIERITTRINIEIHMKKELGKVEI